MTVLTHNFIVRFVASLKLGARIPIIIGHNYLIQKSERIEMNIKGGG